MFKGNFVIFSNLRSDFCSFLSLYLYILPFCTKNQPLGIEGLKIYLSFAVFFLPFCTGFFEDAECCLSAFLPRIGVDGFPPLAFLLFCDSPLPDEGCLADDDCLADEPCFDEPINAEELLCPACGSALGCIVEDDDIAPVEE